MGIFTHLISLGIGIYLGIYIDQHYKVPSAENPGELWGKVKEFASQFEKGSKDNKKDS